MSDESMRKYLMLLQENTIVAEEPEFEEIQVDEMLDSHNFNQLLEDLADLRNKLESKQSQENNEDYSEGYEAGLYEAASLIVNLIESKYGRRI